MPNQYGRVSFVLLLTLSLMLLVGCGRNRADTAPEPQQPAVVEAPTPTPTEPQEAPSANDSPAVETDADSAQSSDTTATATEDSDPASPVSFTTIEAVDAINSYRALIRTAATAPERSDVVTITAEYIKSPPARHIQAQFHQNGQSLDTVELITTNGETFMSMDGGWMQAPDTAFNIDELTVIMPSDLAANQGMNLEEIGVETINERETAHYQGTKDAIPFAQSGSDSFDPSQAGEATVDLWIDTEYNAIVQMRIEVVPLPDSERAEEFFVHFSYSDFNTGFTIEAPDSVTEIPVPPTPEGASLATLLGFEPDLPDETTVTYYGGGRIASILMPLPFEDGFPYFTQQMLDNGFTEVATQEMTDTERIVTYQNATQVIVLTIFGNDLGGTSVNIGGALPAP